MPSGHEQGTAWVYMTLHLGLHIRAMRMFTQPSSLEFHTGTKMKVTLKQLGSSIDRGKMGTLNTEKKNPKRGRK
jgi:hypothetical protein